MTRRTSTLIGVAFGYPHGRHSLWGFLWRGYYDAVLRLVIGSRCSRGKVVVPPIGVGLFITVVAVGCGERGAGEIGLYERQSYRRPVGSVADRSVPRTFRFVAGGVVAVTHADGDSDRAAYRVSRDTVLLFDEATDAAPTAYALRRTDSLFLFVAESEGVRNPVAYVRVSGQTVKPR